MTSRTRKNYLFYLLMLGFFVFLTAWIMERGKTFPDYLPRGQVVEEIVIYGPESGTVDGTGAAANGAVQAAGSFFLDELRESLHYPLAILLLQIISILVVARIFSFLFKQIGQPGVIGEIMAGIVLGPSLLGHFFPETFGFLFAPHSLGPLNVISQLGLILFMFMIGMELDLKIIKQKASETLIISHASIIVPFFLGLVLAYYVYPELGAGFTDFVPFALFIGISVSITAFPVLARIIQERNLGKTQMGMLAIASAANNDVTAWCMLAAIIAITKAGSVTGALYTIGLAALYILFMFAVVRPVLKKVGNVYNNPEVLNKTFVAAIFLVLIFSAYITEILGIHALFGAFLAGVIMPTNIDFRRVMTEKVEDVALVLLLPLFFVFTGLRTEIGLLNTPYLWGICGIFILVSIVGKLAGAAFSARFVGESWKDSLSIGVLMNTRGLMELIVLNIGYELGVLPSSVFVIFVIMALFTTFMATPCLSLIERIYRKRPRAQRQMIWNTPRILISLGNPDSGPLFLRVIDLLGGQYARKARIKAVHYTFDTDTSPLSAGEYAERSFVPLLDEAQRLGFDVETHYEVTDYYHRTLLEMLRRQPCDIVMLGGGPSFVRDYMVRPRRSVLSVLELPRFEDLFHADRWHFPGETAHDKVRRLFESIDSMVCVLVDRGLSDRITDVGMLLFDHRDAGLLTFALPITERSRLHMKMISKELAPEFGIRLSDMIQECDGRCSLGVADILHDFIGGKQLVIVSYLSWLHITLYMRSLVPQLPTFLVVKPEGGVASLEPAVKQKAHIQPGATV